MGPLHVPTLSRPSIRLLGALSTNQNPGNIQAIPRGESLRTSSIRKNNSTMSVQDYAVVHVIADTLGES